MESDLLGTQQYAQPLRFFFNKFSCPVWLPLYGHKQSNMLFFTVQLQSIKCYKLNHLPSIYRDWPMTRCADFCTFNTLCISLTSQLMVYRFPWGYDTTYTIYINRVNQNCHTIQTIYSLQEVHSCQTIEEEQCIVTYQLNQKSRQNDSLLGVMSASKPCLSWLVLTLYILHKSCHGSDYHYPSTILHISNSRMVFMLAWLSLYFHLLKILRTS